MMDDLISRQAVIEVIDSFDILDGYTDQCDLKYKVQKLPSAEKKGAWVGIDDEPCEVWECDKCGHIVEVDATLKLPNYCPNCGARMEES